MQIEQDQTEIPLNRAPWCAPSLPADVKRHPLIGNTTRVCARLISQTPLSSNNSPLCPILGHPQFIPGIRDLAFRDLVEAGFHQASHFSSGGRWNTIAELSDPTGPFRLDFLRSHQLNHFLRSLTPPATNPQPLTPLEDLCNSSGTTTHTLSVAYSLINAPCADFVPPGMLKWERELNRQFTAADEQRILRFTHKSSICAKTQETSYKLLSRWYRTPVLLHKFFPATPDLCWRCRADRGTLLHIFWSCPGLSRFWRVIREVAQKFTARTIPDDPAFFLLHVSTVPEKTYKKSVIRHLLDAGLHPSTLEGHAPADSIPMDHEGRGDKAHGGSHPHSTQQAGNIYRHLAVMEYFHLLS